MRLPCSAGTWLGSRGKVDEAWLGLESEVGELQSDPLSALEDCRPGQRRVTTFITNNNNTSIAETTAPDPLAVTVSPRSRTLITDGLERALIKQPVTTRSLKHTGPRVREKDLHSETGKQTACCSHTATKRGPFR